MALRTVLVSPVNKCGGKDMDLAWREVDERNGHRIGIQGVTTALEMKGLDKEERERVLQICFMSWESA